MFEQSAQPRVMQLPRRRRFAIRLRKFRVGKQRIEQPLQVRICKALDAGLKLAPQRAHVLGGGGQHVQFVGLAGLRLAQLIDLHLRAIVVARDRSRGP